MKMLCQQPSSCLTYGQRGRLTLRGTLTSQIILCW